jgi:superfamily II DNA or RNA helicase
MELRPYQREAIDRIQNAWSTCQSVMLQMPTGTGKTNVFCELIRIHRNQSIGKRILVLTHRRELVEQTKNRLKSFGIVPGVIIAGEKESPDHQVQVGTVQSLAKRKDSIRYLQSVSLIIVDEAHHTPAKTYRELINKYSSKDTHLLGVTATPRRSDDQGFSDIFQVLIRSWQIKEFIKVGYLADVVHRKTATYYDLRNKLEYINIDPETKDYDENELSALMSTDRQMADCVKSYIRYKGESRRSIVFAVNVAHSKSLTQRFLDNNIKAAHVDGTTDPMVRKNILMDFRNGIVSVLCNVGIIAEGFDCPDAEIVQLARPTKSITLYLQQVGRVMRPKANRSHALILDSASCFDEFGSAKANRLWKLDSEGNGQIDSPSPGEGDKALEPEEDGEIQIKVDEPERNKSPLTTAWFNTLDYDYRTYFTNRFSHLDSEDKLELLNAIWKTKEWNLSGLQFKSISSLRDLVNTASLNISSMNCNSLRPIMTLNNLTTLNLANTQVERLRLPDSGKENLRSLNVSNTNLKDISLIGEYPKLEKLMINSLDLNSASYKALATLKHIRMFIGKKSNFSSLSTLHESMNSMEVLQLNDSMLKNLATVHHFQNLRYLDIRGTAVTTLDRIWHCRSLETLIVKGLNIDKDEIRALKNRQPVIWVED